MSRVSAKRVSRLSPPLDLQSIRDTLLYISSDIERVEGMQVLAGHLRDALAELEKIDGATGHAPAPCAMTFVPARME